MNILLIYNLLLADAGLHQCNLYHGGKIFQQRKVAFVHGTHRPLSIVADHLPCPSPGRPLPRGRGAVTADPGPPLTSTCCSLLLPASPLSNARYFCGSILSSTPSPPPFSSSPFFVMMVFFDRSFANA